MTKQKKSIKKTRQKAVSAGKPYERVFETDGTYFLKLVVFVLLGAFWIRFGTPVTWLGILLPGIPVGLLLGLILVRQFEKIQSDRKIWYAVLLVITIISYFYPTGVVI